MPARSKPRWDDEEVLLLARQELSLIRSGKEMHINMQLEEIQAGTRTLESIKGLRKQKRYRAVLASLEEEEEQAADAELRNTMDQSLSDVTERVSQPTAELEILVNTNYPTIVAAVRSGNESAVKALVGRDYERLVRDIALPSRRNNIGYAGSSPQLQSLRRARREQSVRIQKLFKKNRRRCAEHILEGKWKVTADPVPADSVLRHWKEILQREPPEDPRSFAAKPILHELARPITIDEFGSAIKNTESSAPDIDGLHFSYLKSLNRERVVRAYNLWMFTGHLPNALSHGVTTLIPKDPHSTDDPTLRPITMDSVLVRGLHTILARRFDESLPLGRQKAFRAGEGPADYIYTLRSILSVCKRVLQPICLCLIDASKDFESIGHSTLIKACTRMGVPEMLLRYIENFYVGSTTRLKFSNQIEDIKVTCGVKQGDPLSVHLFDAVMDWALSALDDKLAIKIGKATINHLAFADHVVLIARTPFGLQSNLNAFQHQLTCSGMSLDIANCCSFRLAVDGKKKKWIADDRPFLTISGAEVKAMEPREKAKYLGIGSTVGQSRAEVTEDLHKKISEIDAAPLKPQQRLYITANHLVPSMHHQLLLCRTSAEYLKTIDRHIRATIRGWLRLPHDTPYGFFHAATSGGGLGLAPLQHHVPLLKTRRIKRLKASNDEVIKTIARLEEVHGKQGRTVKLQREDGIRITNKEDFRLALLERLHKSVDGKGLKVGTHYGNWANDSLLSGETYIGAIKVKGNLMPTKVRRSRGRSGAPIHCDVCGRPSTLGHVLQVCPRTRFRRIQRHNKIAIAVTRDAKKAGLEVLWAPRIRTSEQLYKPDLVLVDRTKNTSFITDITVVADNADLDREHDRKCVKYNIPAIHRWVRARTKTARVTNSAIAMSWRGAISGKSAEDLVRVIGANKRGLSLYSAACLEGGYSCWEGYNRSAYRARMRR